MTVDHEHRALIRTSDRTLFVQAGAGTGKTTALVARVVHLLATGRLEHPGQLAAITFTENAAAELRNRVREALHPGPHGRYVGETDDDQYDEQQRTRLERAAEHLDDAVLTTLHGFASRILSEAPLEAGLPPGFSVAGTLVGGDDADRGWEQFREELLQDPTMRKHLLRGLALGLNLRTMRNVAESLGSSWDRLLSRPLTVVPAPRISGAPVVAELTGLLASSSSWPDDALGRHLREIVVPFVAELDLLDDDLDLLEHLAGSSLGCKQGQAKLWKAAGLDKPTVVDTLTHAEDTRADVVRRVGGATAQSLAARVQEWLLDQAEARKDRGELDYHDLLVLARDLLRGDPVARRRLHDQWRVLLLDEFQDTDPLQVEIACLIAGTCGERESRPWHEIPVDAGRLFFVGDAKQSIYRFRRADIDLFNQVADHHLERPELSVSFRSAPGILSAANTAFRSLFDPAHGIPYTDLLGERGAGTQEQPVLLLGGPQDKKTPAAQLRLLECAHLADVAVRAKAERWQVGEGQDASYRDMAILLPTRTTLPALERALQAREVPYRIESRSLVWSTDAVRGLVALLQAIDQPADEVALLAALRHPGLACSDADLVHWRAADGRWSLWGETPKGLDDDHPVATALRALARWHDQRCWLPVNGLVEQVVRELRLVELTASQRRPRDHWRRLRFLVDQARAWCDAGGSGLGQFVGWAARQVDEEVDVLETVVPEEDDDAVRILTVHGSKGLEFPITMVAGLSTVARRTSQVLWHGDKPEVRFKSGSLETSGFVAAAGDDKLQGQRESIRLLYVALTRAMDHLVIGCYHCPAGNPESASPAERLWGLLQATDPSRTENACPAAGPTSEADAGTWGDLPDRGVFAVDRAGLLEQVQLRVATSPTSLTVLVAPEDEPVHAEPVEVGYRPRGSSRGAAIGTATHRVLELLSTLASPATEEISRLARLACAESSILELQHDIESRVRSALDSDRLRDALDGGRALREVYLVFRDRERFVEGYVDLLVQRPDGTVVLDYKTDRAVTEAERELKEKHYAPQLAAYATGVERVTGEAPSLTSLIFASPS